MIPQYSKQFRKEFERLPLKKQQKTHKTIEVFIRSPKTRPLRLHELKGPLAGVWSISAGGDLRLHFRYMKDGTVVFFLAVGSHSQLY